ncbi:MAG: PilZ domain-containing protein [Thermodesulfovibrionales bacterium]|nr:PilZ domain-containing protein [Thermodesulfovibrionales bacterium]
MKTICLIKDKRPFWNEIAGHLRDANAKVVALEQNEGAAVLRSKPDIVITGEAAFRGLSGEAKDIPRIVIVDGKPPEERLKNVRYLMWPEDKEHMLEITSQMLHVSERRLFKAVIGIERKGEKAMYMGRSENFSETGLAFKVDTALKAGDTVLVSFYVMGIDKRVSLEAEVARSGVDPDDGSAYYGARFINLTHKDKEILSGFVGKGR